MQITTLQNPGGSHLLTVLYLLNPIGLFLKIVIILNFLLVATFFIYNCLCVLYQRERNRYRHESANLQLKLIIKIAINTIRVTLIQIRHTNNAQATPVKLIWIITQSISMANDTCPRTKDHQTQTIKAISNEGIKNSLMLTGRCTQVPDRMSLW